MGRRGLAADTRAEKKLEGRQEETRERELRRKRRMENRKRGEAGEREEKEKREQGRLGWRREEGELRRNGKRGNKLAKLRCVRFGAKNLGPINSSSV